MQRLTRLALVLGIVGVAAFGVLQCQGARRVAIEVADRGYAAPEGEPRGPEYTGPDASRPHLAVRLEPVARGLSRITDVQFVPGDPELAVVLQKGGQATWIDLAKGTRGPLFHVDVHTVSEQGLLGLAFHPNFAKNGRFYVDDTPDVHPDVTRIAEWHTDDVRTGGAQPTRVLLEVRQPYQNHNAGQLAFGPKGMLFVGFGDGGFRADPQGNGQDPTTLLATMLRLDVDHPAGGKPYGIPPDNPYAGDPKIPGEVWATGLRNPWRFSFAPDGRLVVGDVGQDTWEEVDVVQAGDNLGWNVREARHCFPPGATCTAGGFREPVYEYGRDDGNSITGGYVYTGRAIPELKGRYVFGDFATGRIRAIDLPAGDPGTMPIPTATALGKWPVLISTFARDARGEIYVADYGGGVLYRLAPASKPPGGDEP